MVSMSTAKTLVGAAEGTKYSNIDNVNVASKANSRSGVSFGLTQLDTSQVTGRNALKEILDDAVSTKSIESEKREKMMSRFSGTTTKDALTSDEKSELNKILKTDNASRIISNHDTKRITKMDSDVSKLLKAAKAAWEAKGKKNIPSLTDDENGEYIKLYGYVLASLNKRDKSASFYKDFLCGKTVMITGESHVLSEPPTAESFSEMAKKLTIWNGKGGNGDYKNLDDRMGIAFKKLNIAPSATPAAPPKSGIPSRGPSPSVRLP